MLRKFAFAALVATLSVAPAMAQVGTTLQYELFGAPGFTNTYTFNFQLDTARAPSFLTSDTLRFAPTTVQYTLSGSTTVRTGSASNIGPSFFAPINQGGFSILRLNEADPQPRFFGPALFTGATTRPTFLTGTFALSDMPRNVPSDVQVFNYTLRVTRLGAVPEPGTWAMMLVGFGAAGVSLRRRRHRLPAGA